MPAFDISNAEHAKERRAELVAPAPAKADNSPAAIAAPVRSALGDGVDDFLAAMHAKVAGKPRAEQSRLLAVNIQNWERFERELFEAARANSPTPRHLIGLNAWMIARCRLALLAMRGQIEGRAA